ncbi:hypothetical protein [Arthrobacter silvisoli]|uniref:hypothetical protein n=1 Tax=Arthrobacter silvisoli TaxID=2291022 RepID=UPI000E21936D|nr:hypothetical protein [Arthrobacter silvisoli]
MNFAALGKTVATAALAIALGATAACAPTPASGPSGPTAGPALTLTSSATDAGKPVQGTKAKPVKTFTFPDGHISFRYQAGWTVATADCPTVPGGPAECVEATIGSKGKAVAFMVSGFYGDGASGPVDRTVFDATAVPGLAGFEGTPTFGFFKDSYGDVNDHYFMDVRRAEELVSGSTGSGSGQVTLPNGVGIFRVYIDSPGFASDAEARAWMGTAEYAQLKALLMSVSYK